MDAAAYFDSLANLGVEPSLTAIRSLCARLNNPQSAYKVIQVTGTNGKTSTARAIAAILGAEGLRCGLYTSPHLVRYNERVSVNGRQITDREFDLVLREVRPQISACEQDIAPRQVTQFEALSAVALRYFAEQSVDVAVLEVGMGARWDATSVASPRVGVITGIDIDHADYLGGTLASIASEKSYVARDGNILVTGRLPASALAAVRARAHTFASRAYIMGDDFDATGEGVDFKVSGLCGVYPGLTTTLWGSFQVANTGIAVAAAEAFLGRGLDLTAVRQATRQLTSPGRLQIVPGVPPLLLDGAHNKQGAGELAKFISEKFADVPITFVLSVLGDKDVAGIIGELLTLAAAVVTTTNENARALGAEELRSLVEKQGFSRTLSSAASIGRSLNMARRYAGKKGLVCVTGSLYGVGEALTDLALA